MTFIDHGFYLNHQNMHNIAIYNKTDTCQALVSLDINTHIPETLMQKNHMGIIGNRIMGKFFGKCWKE